MAAAKKRPTQKQIDAELGKAKGDYEELCRAIHKQLLWNVASRLGMAPEELEDDWASIT